MWMGDGLEDEVGPIVSIGLDVAEGWKRMVKWCDSIREADWCKAMALTCGERNSCVLNAIPFFFSFVLTFALYYALF